MYCFNANAVEHFENTYLVNKKHSILQYFISEVTEVSKNAFATLAWNHHISVLLWMVSLPLLPLPSLSLLSLLSHCLSLSQQQSPYKMRLSF